MLFWKECKKILFSLAFVLYVIVTAAMYFTQFHNDCAAPITAPVPGQDNYGTVAKEIPELLMPAAAESLVSGYLENSYVAYPIGFYKNVHLSEKKKVRMASIITEITGITQAQLDSMEDYQPGGFQLDDNGNIIYVEGNLPEISVLPELTYARFRELMQEADDIIGGGSDYSESYLVGTFSRVPQTYEDALAEYNAFFSEDKITRAYARLFCDYMGIVLAILPVFVAVFLAALDRRSQMEQLAYSRKISSAKLIFTRYAALVTVMLVPVILCAGIATAKVSSLYQGCDTDPTAIFRYSSVWLLPNIMTAAAVGMLLTELTSSMLAIFVQGAAWFTSIFISTDLTGSIGKFTLVVRHNSLYGLDVFTRTYDNFIFNRVFYALASIAAIALTAYFYDRKRRGVFHGLSFRGKALSR